jgi:hypothetical protein
VCTVYTQNLVRFSMYMYVKFLYQQTSWCSYFVDRDILTRGRVLRNTTSSFLLMLNHYQFKSKHFARVLSPGPFVSKSPIAHAQFCNLAAATTMIHPIARCWSPLIRPASTRCVASLLRPPPIPTHASTHASPPALTLHLGLRRAPRDQCLSFRPPRAAAGRR